MLHWQCKSAPQLVIKLTFSLNIIIRCLAELVMSDGILHEYTVVQECGSDLRCLIIMLLLWYEEASSGR